MKKNFLFFLLSFFYMSSSSAIDRIETLRFINKRLYKTTLKREDGRLSYCSSFRLTHSYFLTAAHCLEYIEGANVKRSSFSGKVKDFAVATGYSQSTDYSYVNVFGNLSEIKNDFGFLKVRDASLGKIEGDKEVVLGSITDIEKKNIKKLYMASWSDCSDYTDREVEKMPKTFAVLKEGTIEKIDQLRNKIYIDFRGSCSGDSGSPVFYLDRNESVMVIIGVLSAKGRISFVSSWEDIKIPKRWTRLELQE